MINKINFNKPVYKKSDVLSEEMEKMQILNDNGKKTERALLMLYKVIFGKRNYSDKSSFFKKKQLYKYVYMHIYTLMNIYSK